MTRVLATRDVELALLERAGVVIGMDEVGRGALAGPVAVGACAVTGDEGVAPSGLADSKLLTPKRREALVPLVGAWAPGAVGFASNAEVDRWGIVGALRLAGMRALAELMGSGSLVAQVRGPALVLLDGSHDWLTPPEDLLAELDGPELPEVEVPEVLTRVKADASCTAVAAASVLAKVARDRWMTQAPDPGYDWASNKGYASPAHVAGLERLGPGPLHRVSWRLPGTGLTPAR